MVLEPRNEENGQRLAGVTKLEENDILCGRGGVPLKFPGNLSYRKMVGLNKELYATCVKEEKLRISRSIVAAIREKNGRFLEREDGKISKSLSDKDGTGNPVTWRDIGDKKAVEKTSQALREGQPKLKQKIYRQEADGLPMHGYQGHHVGVAPQASMQTLQLQQTVPDNFKYLPGGVQVDLPGRQSPRNPFQPQHHTVLALPSVAEQGEQFKSFPQNSFVEDSYGNAAEGDPRQDSWGAQDPMPLPHQHVSNGSVGEHHVFSNDDQKQLLRSLSLEGENSNKRSSVTFQDEPEPRRTSISAMSIATLRSELDAFSDTLSLDSALDAAHREAEFDLLGEFGACDMSIGTFASPVRRTSSARERSRKRSGNFRPRNVSIDPSTAPPTTPIDLGMIFTSTLDDVPGGINSGTDVSGFMGMCRESIIDADMESVNIRLSSLSRISRLSSRSRMSRMSSISRISMCSGLTDLTPRKNRNTFDTLQTIQSSEFSALMAEIQHDERDT